MRDAFGHRRKTIRNGLVASGRDGAVVERALTQAGVDPRLRPERLDMGQLASIYSSAAG